MIHNTQSFNQTLITDVINEEANIYFGGISPNTPSFVDAKVRTH
jgi:hypothetical protein